MAEKRNSYLDEVKGLASILVVLGHAIQFGNGRAFLENRLFLNNMLFKAIYSFHMPLFAIISGYLLSFSFQRRTPIQVMKSRVLSLGIALAVWSAVNSTIEVVNNGLASSMIGIAKQIFWSIIGTHWFLWAIMYCTICVVLIRNCFKDSLWVYLLLFFLDFLITDKFNLEYYKFLYPFFVAGYFWNEKCMNQCDIILKAKRRYLCTGVAFLVAWGILLQFYNADCLIYQTGFSILNKTNWMQQVMIDCFRIVIGLCGSLATMIFVGQIKSSGYVGKVLALFGKNSLGIYIVNTYVSLYIVKPLFCDATVNIIRTLLIAIVSAAVCLLLVKGIAKSRMLNQLMFGGK